MSGINIPAILIANLMGLFIILVIIMGNSWQSKRILDENRSLSVMFYTSFALCIADPVCFLADGKPGVICFHLVYGGNLCLFIGNILISVMWLRFVSSRMNSKIPPAYLRFLIGGVIFEGAMMLANFFYPLLFYVDANNVYHRAGYYWVYMVYYFLLLIYSAIFCLIERKKSGGLRHVPLWTFFVPALIGIVIQMLVYGVSTITPFLTVSMVCMYNTLQDEFIYRDKLTGLYNRFYLDVFTEKIASTSKEHYSMMMLDLNEFKSINDDYGHYMGDQALINTANVLLEVVGVNGLVIRYAGDEFIIILNTYDEAVLESTAQRIKESLLAFSQREKSSYELSASIGYGKLPENEKERNSFIEILDKRMYMDKREHYKA